MLFNNLSQSYNALNLSLLFELLEASLYHLPHPILLLGIELHPIEVLEFLDEQDVRLTFFARFPLFPYNLNKIRFTSGRGNGLGLGGRINYV